MEKGDIMRDVKMVERGDMPNEHTQYFDRMFSLLKEIGTNEDIEKGERMGILASLMCSALAKLGTIYGKHFLTEIIRAAKSGFNQLRRIENEERRKGEGNENN